MSTAAHSGIARAVRASAPLACMLVMLAFASAADAADVVPAGGRVFGGGKRVDLVDLPQGDFRRRLEKLAPAASARALAKLATVSIPEADLAALRVDDEGGIMYVCFDAVLAAPAPAAAASVVAGAGPITAPPLYHSRPGSAKVLYLDFNGHAITGTAWNSAKASIPALPFDLDGDRSTFSSAETTAIQQVWQRVSEDYAPFDVDVTTEEPTTWTPTTGRVLITLSTDADGVALPSSSGGGVAYVNVFGASNYAYYQPALVFFDHLASREDYIAEACTHEAGHNLGLSHDGTTAGAAYYGGQGSGETSWAPIMGVGYNMNLSQWSKGEYAGANNTQDDLAIIAGKTAYRPDDYGNSAASATVLAVSSGGSFAASGVISSRTDIDVFALSVGAGPLSITVGPWRSAVDTIGGDLDVSAWLTDAAGNLIAAANPLDRTDATIAVTVASGVYYLQVDGIGLGDPLGTGYTDYASLGQYTVSGTSTPATAGDTVAPAAITTLAVVGSTTSSLTLRWSATGDDGNSGTATSYDVRYATSPITSANWAAATQAAGEPSPAPAGTTETWTLGGLSSGTAYWIAVVARDEVGNTGGLSNVAAATTASVPPPPPSGETVWVEDAVPAGAAQAADGGDSWTWTSANPAPFSGALASQSAISAGEHQHYFYGASTTLAVKTGDVLFAYVYLDPANPPSEVMLQWNDGSWEHRAYWGANLVGWGADGTVSRLYRGALPAAGQWVRLSVPASAVGLEGRTLNGMAFTLSGGRATWDRAGAGSSAPPSETVWVEDAVPAGAAQAGDGGDAWTWTNANPAPFSGSLASQSNIAGGEHQHYFYGASATLAVKTGEALFAYVYLDPANPPSEVMLQWNDGSWEHRAYWGANLVGWGADGTTSRLYQGALPPTGQWVRLSVPAAAVGLEGRVLNGMAFTLSGGRATWDRAGTATAATPTETVWVEDAVPTAGAQAADGGDSWSWTSANPAPFSGAVASQSAISAGEHQHYFYGASATLAVNAGDTLFAYVYLDPANPPSEVMLQWNDGSWEHRAYWGANLVGWGADGTVSRRYQGALPVVGQWVRLAVPASAVGLEGRVLNGMAFTLYGGRATWDHAGTVPAGGAPAVNGPVLSSDPGIAGDDDGASAMGGRPGRGCGLGSGVALMLAVMAFGMGRRRSQKGPVAAGCATAHTRTKRRPIIY